MQKIRVLVLSAALLLSAPVATYAESPNPLPDAISFGLGGFDVVQNQPRLQSLDFRVEYRSGLSLLGWMFETARPLDNWFQVHPFGGIEFTARGQTYSFGGFVLDFLIGRHIVFSPNFAAGYYTQGNGKDLGNGLEFRSTLEAGWRFDNNVRLTGFFGHTSNAGTGRINPGAEEAGIYLHLPVNSLFNDF